MNSAFWGVKWKATGGIKQNIGMSFTFEQGHFDCYFWEVPQRINNRKRETSEGATPIIRERRWGLGPGGSSGRWSDAGHVLTIEPIWFAPQWRWKMRGKVCLQCICGCVFILLKVFKYRRDVRGEGCSFHYSFKYSICLKIFMVKS